MREYAQTPSALAQRFASRILAVAPSDLARFSFLRPAHIVDRPGVNSSDNRLEAEADRTADQVIAPATSSKGPLSLPSRPARYDPNDRRPGGRPLEEATRESMEHRFGFDFSKVRIHDDASANRSARDLNARAYTSGADIVFGAGEWSPSTAKGRQLIAHELTHVVQQSRGAESGRIQRKQINASAWDSATKRLPPKDWYALDREEWAQASVSGTESSLNPTNTFMRAAWHNTVNLLPGEYESVSQRHDYYDLISYVIEHDPGTPQAVRGVRFFHATTMVTGSPGIGSVDRPVGAIKLGPESRQILRDVNVELFARNMKTIRDLLSSWKEPRDPQTPAKGIGAFDFDVRMVETEQATVEKFIKDNSKRFTASVTGEINATMDPTAFGQWANPSKTTFEWALEALGVSKLDFTIRAHRQAIGFASVHMFHRKGKQDYLTFMKKR